MTLNIPAWVADEEAPYPCPCGLPMEGEVIMLEGEKGLRRMFHLGCIPEFFDGEDGEDE